MYSVNSAQKHLNKPTMKNTLLYGKYVPTEIFKSLKEVDEELPHNCPMHQETPSGIDLD